MARWEDLLRQAAQAGLKLLTQERRSPSPGRPPRPAGRARTAPARDRARRLVYAPDLDGAADPGEIVWTWVAYEEGDGRGKYRPVLVVGRDHGELLGLMLSSRADHADDRDWLGIGSGRWDARPAVVRAVGPGDRGRGARDPARGRGAGRGLVRPRRGRVRSRYGWT